MVWIPTTSISTDPVIISLTSSPSSSVMAGDNVTLTCSVTLPTRVTGIPDFRWEGPGEVTPADPTTNGQEVSSVLPLSTISTSQAGQYICTATLNGSSVTIATNVTVQSKFLRHFTVVTLSCRSHLFLSPRLHSIHYYHCQWRSSGHHHNLHCGYFCHSCHNSGSCFEVSSQRPVHQER